MRRRWLRRVSLFLSFGQLVLSYRFSRLPRRARVLRLLLVQIPAFVAAAVRSSRPSSVRSEWWYVGSQILTSALSILAHRYPHRRPLLGLVGFLAGMGMFAWQRRRLVSPRTYQRLWG